MDELQAKRFKMKFVIVFGPLAVGKMTVGQELEKITDLKLFHNHMTIEMVLPYFEMYSAGFNRLVDLFRIEIFKEVAKSDLAGLIFTFVWHLDSKKNDDFIQTIVDIFEKENTIVCFVELEANTTIRLERNRTPNRLKFKPSKIDFEASKQELLEIDRKHILNSEENQFRYKNHIKINNSNLSAYQVAKIIKQQFNL